MLPLFDYFETYLDDFQENARHNFGCRGIQVPLAMTTNGTVTPRGYSSWTAGAGWIAQHFYDYYLFTGDVDFLKNRAVPWLKEVALHAKANARLRRQRRRGAPRVAAPRL